MNRHLCPVLALLVSAASLHAEDAKPARAFTNHLGMQFVRIAPGSFMMGSPGSEKSRGDDEGLH